jgi:hypothetical protein
VKPFKVLQNRSKTNVFVSDCEEEEKRKKRSFVLFSNKAKKNEYNRSSTIEDLPLLLGMQVVSGRKPADAAACSHASGRT